MSLVAASESKVTEPSTSDTAEVETVLEDGALVLDAIRVLDNSDEVLDRPMLDADTTPEVGLIVGDGV